MLDELEAENGRTYELTSAIGVGHDKIEDVNYGDAIQYMDYIFAMTYDFYGGWNNVLGHQTALNCGNFMRPGQCDGSGVDENGEPYTGPAYTTDNGIQLLLEQGVPANKLVVGTAMYGRGWEGVLPSTLSDPSDPMTGVGNGKLKGSSAQGVWEDGVIDYKGIKANMLGANNQGINGFEYGYDEMAEAPYVWNRTSGQLITFDDDRSVKAKGAYVRSLGLAGLFSWEIDADNGDILNAMHEGLAGGTTDPVNRKPTAAAGADQAVEGPASVSLDGSASKDSDGTIASYVWSQVSGTAVTLANANAAVASFDVVEVAQQETLTFSLTVTDNEGATSTDTVVVTVNPKDTGPVNTAPVAVVTAPAEVNAGDVVVVDASASSDADQDTLTFTWDVPAGIDATVQGSSVSFVAAEYTQDTTLNFSVTVSDGTETSVAATSVNVLKKTTGGGTCTNAWDSGAVYTGGDQVTQGGKVWEAKWWTTGEDPTTTGQWGVWKEIGPASCAN
jgi:chitinase